MVGEFLLLQAFVSWCVDVMCEAVAVCMLCIFLCQRVVSDMFSMPVAFILISNLTLHQDAKLKTVVPASLRDRRGLEIKFE